MPDTAGEDTLIPIGVYRGASPDIGAIRAYEAFLGMPPGTTAEYVLAFMADSPAWPQFEAAMLQSSTNGPAGSHSAAEWGPLLGNRTLMLGVPACASSTSWADEASGRNDAHWIALTATLVRAGLGHSVLRIAREFQGGWPWKVTQANAADHRAGYAHIVGIMRQAGFTGQFMWNPYIGTFSPPSEVVNAYPGDMWVDVIGIDFYDGGYPVQPDPEPRSAAQQQAVWNSFRDQWDGLTGWQSFAQAHNKPLAYPEWGLGLWRSGGSYGGGGDNPVLIREMAAWIKYTSPYMHALWEDPGMGVADPDNHPRRIIAVPNSRAAFLEAFGYA